MKVIEWLGLDSKGVPYYLHPLNLVWSDKGVDHDLQLYREVAGRLAHEPAYWSELIRANSWRHSLIGCISLLVSGKRDFFDDLCYRFRGSSFVTPQIAVTLGLLHAEGARPFLATLMGEAVRQDNAKQASAAYQVLLRLGENPVGISLDSRNALWHSDVEIAAKVVHEHWEFWSQRI